ncbi:MAG: PIN domain-containing protein [Actinophytocola sp.]|nr:PIN domain-containing protein [Actinophytocola sp.]
MTTKVADRVVLDTNVLLSATDTGRPEFDRARAALDDWPARGTVLYTSGQILREYLSVATRPVERNGLGLPQPDAIANITALRDRLHLLAENDKVADRMLDLLTTTTCGGKQVHDANIVATMLTHGVHTLVTLNVGDFARFDHAIDVVPL